MVKTGRRTGDAEVYEGARRFKEALRRRDSAFTPGRPVWTPAAFDALNRHFVSAPETSEGSFEEKLIGQLAAAGDDARQLMGELLALHLLPTAVIGAPKKAEIIGIALGTMSDPVAVPDDIGRCLRHGIVNPGTYYNTGRPAQLRYLVRVGAHLTALDPEDSQALFDDPWAFRDAIDAVPLEGAATQRHALLHLFFPDTYEPIVSDDHVGKIIATFAEHADTITGDPDRDLMAIRAALTPTYGDDFDFYGSRLKSRWDQGTDPWADVVTWAERIYRFDGFDERVRAPATRAVAGYERLQTALTAGDETWVDELGRYLRNGDDGMLGARIAASVADWARRDPSTARQAILDLLDGTEHEGVRVQDFADTIAHVVRSPGNRSAVAAYLLMGKGPAEHPMYRPEAVTAFLGLVGSPHRSGEGARYVHAAQTYDDLIAELAERRGVTLRDRLDAQSVIELMVTVQPDHDVIAGWADADRDAFFRWRDGFDPPGTRPQPDDASSPPPTQGAGPDQTVDYMGRAAQSTHLPVSYLHQLRTLLDDKGQLVLYGPPGTGKTFVAQVLARAIAGGDDAAVGMVQFHPSFTYEDFFEGIRPITGDEGTLRYEVVPGPLARMAAQAEADPHTTYVMVIDELNRANLPKVLGELLFLFEYRDRAITTMYRPDRPFRLPRNLQFIATMNTVDRSVALVDAAMRRRFHFVPFYPDSDHVRDVLASVCSDDEAWVAELVEQVNAELVHKLGSRDHQLGASHFIRADRTVDGIEQVWRYTIEPMIEDQLFGQEHRMAEFRWPAVKRRFIDASGIATDAPTGTGGPVGDPAGDPGRP